MGIDRRDFIKGSVAMASALAVGGGGVWLAAHRGLFSRSSDITGHVFRGQAPDFPGEFAREGMFYEKMGGKSAVCSHCPHRCRLAPGDLGICRNRANINGVVYSLVYGNPCSVNLDPVEKKPLFHFLPATTAFSIATAGCNFRCLNCQNWEISQRRPDEVRHRRLFPEEVVREAQKAGAASIAYTYSEPVTFFEYMFDTAAIARGRGIHGLLISNGYINPEPLAALCRVIAAANINLKAFDETTYRSLDGGGLAPVLEALKILHSEGVHLEVTHLVIPGYTDGVDELKRMCAWLLANLGPDVPLHFLRFFPRYRLSRLEPTPVRVIEEFRRIAMKEGIHYAYTGNIGISAGANTWCHNCGKLLVERKGYLIPVMEIRKGRCRYCGTRIPGVWPL